MGIMGIMGIFYMKKKEKGSFTLDACFTIIQISLVEFLFFIKKKKRNQTIVLSGFFLLFSVVINLFTF